MNGPQRSSALTPCFAGRSPATQGKLGPSPTGAGEGSSSSPLPPRGRGVGGEGRSPSAVAELIASCGIPASEARALLALALDCTRESLIADPLRTVDAAAADRFARMCARRLCGEPMAYLAGQREFFGRRFLVDRSVLIPRPETECLVEAALRQMEGRSSPRVIDLGTGSGCIAITLSLERPDARVVATEVSESALNVARSNARALGAGGQFLLGSWYTPARGRFDLIVSNPPYVAAADPHLAELGCEPRSSLTDEGDGLSCLRAIVGQAGAHLSEDGALLVEHGYDQGAAVRELARQSGFRSVRTLTDLAGLERVCLASVHADLPGR
ncbi:MAG TPA: peptide chain release factor N(5)-glutamine methyltransferase [Burkholderiaceae bacterium]|nr:peptide chain release factor N(5)-glutamine methyltransferase [Burkholderiaceae bacterium]